MAIVSGCDQKSKWQNYSQLMCISITLTYMQSSCVPRLSA
jgi:hypothetical protein